MKRYRRSGAGDLSRSRSGCTAMPASPVDVRRPSAGRPRFRTGSRATEFLASLGLDPTRRPWRCCRAAAATSCTRIAPDHGRSAAADSCAGPGVQFVVACAPTPADALFAPLVRSGADVGAVPHRQRWWCAAGHRRRAGGGDVGDHRVGNGHRAGGAARAADGRRLPAVAADLQPGQAVRQGRHLRDAQPGRRPPDRAAN